MKNPYADQHDDVEIRLGRGAAWVFAYLFLLLITLPPLYRNLSEGFKPVTAIFTPQSSEGIVAHLKAFEKTIEDAPFTEPPRAAIQTLLTRGPLHEGNTKTHIGRAGWLYFKTALDSLTGYGPLRPEPDSVAKDPNRKPWQPPLAAITTFAAQLAETDTDLLLVPIPVKPMIYPEHLGIETDAPLKHPDAEEFYSQIDQLPNVEVLDLTDTFWNAKSETQVFLKQDTHWTPEGMWIAAEAIAEAVDEAGLGTSQEPAIPIRGDIRESYGDLVEKLDIGAANFPREMVKVNPLPTVQDHGPFHVLLGDSFTNIYADSLGLDWGSESGLGRAIGLWLGTSLDVIAINGGGATEVREALARRRGAATLMKEKKLVIWAIAARDLFLSKTAAKSAQVEWEDVTFDTRKLASQVEYPIRVRARLVARPDLPNPKTTSYTALLYIAEYELIETLDGDTPPETEDRRFLVAHWAFENRQLKRSADYKVGSERTMTLTTLASQKQIAGLEQRNDSDLFLDLLWDTTPPPVAAASGRSPLVPGSACAIYALLLGAALGRRYRAGLSN